MQQPTKYMVTLLAVGALLLLACSGASAKEAKVSPSKVEPIQGSNVGKVTLLESAMKRIALQTAPLRETPLAPRAGGQLVLRKVVPYSAAIYDLTGATWVYTNPEPLVYVRQSIIIEYVQGDTAVLQAGPPAGTQIVVVGASELYGAETGVGK